MTQLTLMESQKLTAYETTIERGLETFIEVGDALSEIRDGKLYRKDWGTFAEYLKGRWGMARSRGYQLIDASKVVSNVHHGGQTSGSEPPQMPDSERQIRPLTKLPDEEQADAWHEAVDRSGGKPTAADVAQIVEERLSVTAKAEGEPAHRPLAQHLTSGGDEWYTPQIYLDAARDALGGIELDPASSPIANQTVKADVFYTKEDNGLDHLWDANTMFCNPPYSKVKEFSERWATAPVGAAILLVNANTETRWFQPLLDFHICLCDHRIKFEREDGTIGKAPANASAFIYRGDDPDAFRKYFRKFGRVGKLS